MESAMTALTFPASRPLPHLAFRGTRILTAIFLGWTGLIVLSFGVLGLTTPPGAAGGTGDPGLYRFINAAAPWLVALGVAHIVAAIGIGRDRRWAFHLALWMLALGLLIVLTGLVAIVAGRDAFAVVDPLGRRDGLGVLLVAVGLYGLVGWGIRRIAEARRLS
jgi:hypothetical protein